MTGEQLSNLIEKTISSNPYTVLLKSVEGIAIPAAQNLGVIGIANEIITSNSMMSNEKVITFLKRLCFN